MAGTPADRRKGQQQMAASRREQGDTWLQVAERLRAEWPELSPRAAIRIAHGWSLNDVCDRWGTPLSAAQLSRWENWRRDMSLGSLRRMAELYEVAVSDLVADIGDYRHLDPRAQADAAGSKAAVHPVEGSGAGPTLSETWEQQANPETLATIIDRMEVVARHATPSEADEALCLAACAHLALGDAAFDQLRFTTAVGHFQQAHEFGLDVDHPDIVALAVVRQGDVARRRRRYQAADRAFATSGTLLAATSPHTRARHWQTVARTRAEQGDRPNFLEAIDRADDALGQPRGRVLDALPPLDPRHIRFERAHGLTLLGRPAAALEIYDADSSTSRLIGRERTNFALVRAQALAGAGELQEGVALAISGLAEARAVGSPRLVSRVQRMYDRLSGVHRRTDPHLTELGDALAS